MNKKEKPRPEQQTPTLQQSLELAVQHHTAGRLPEAESIYQQVLQADPNHPVALHLLGVIAHQVGKHEIAVELITSAIALKPDLAEAHNNLGNALQELGRLDDAVASYNKALAIKPDYAMAHNNLGNTLKETGRLEDAVASYQMAIHITPDNVEAHSNLGIALKEMGRLDDAVASFAKALEIKPDYAEAHSNLGNVFKEAGRLDDAVSCYRKAIQINPDFFGAHSNLGNALYNLGALDDAVASHRTALALNPENAEAHGNLGNGLWQLGYADEAFSHYRTAISLKPEADLFWAGMSACLEFLSFKDVDKTLMQDLLRLLERTAISPQPISRAVISALRCCPDFSRLLELEKIKGYGSEIVFQDLAGQLAAIPLFLRIIEVSPVPDPEIERMLILIRHAMIREAATEKVEDKSLPFAAALALHCFTNEYVFSETGEEAEAVDSLQQRVAALLENNESIPPICIAALGAYRPLHHFHWAKKLLDHDWPEPLKEVILRQVSEPMEEQSLRQSIAVLTRVREGVSQSVREQYEENPYPRWLKTSFADTARTLDSILRDPPLRLNPGNFEFPEKPEILIAGCGTGKQSLGTATRILGSNILAVDLSLSSLAYAKRKTRELGVSNIDYAQADILELENLDRQFDLVECGGVLHHLDDPLAGWRVLVGLLRPGGVMQIALYSEAARQPVVKARDLIAERGYTASSDDIRRFRQDLMAGEEDQEILRLINVRDFYSLSECRDLLFHVQECRFTIPQIKTALESLGLKFLGFEINDKGVLNKFTEANPKHRDRTSLSRWHKFEKENPYTFQSMYLFWCQKT